MSLLSTRNPCVDRHARRLLVLSENSADVGLDTGIPVLFGREADELFLAASPSGRRGRFALHRSGDFTIGIGFGEPQAGLEQEIHALYEELLAQASGCHLCRIWNYVPAINEVNSQGLENYRAFCRGRSLAFESGYGAGFEYRLPAGTAVGTDASRPMIVFVGSSHPPRHVENPLQVPAYRYPEIFGPRSPSFARATVVPLPDGRCHVFVSGTSSIRGFQTAHPEDLSGQLECTLENLTALGRNCELGSALGAGRCSSRHVRVYLRREEHLAAVMKTLRLDFLHDADRISVLRSDVCRAELLVEIELSVLDLTQSESSLRA